MYTLLKGGAMRFRIPTDVKKTMAIDLADELIRSKAIIVEEEDEFSTQNKIVRIKLRYWL